MERPRGRPSWTNEPTLDTTVCPECGALAEVTERAVLESTAGPVEHARVVCMARHWFLLPAAALSSPHSRSPVRTSLPG